MLEQGPGNPATIVSKLAQTARTYQAQIAGMKQADPDCITPELALLELNLAYLGAIVGLLTHTVRELSNLNARMEMNRVDRRIIK